MTTPPHGSPGREPRPGARPDLRAERSLPVPDPIEALSDLEAQAAAWSREERDAEVEDRAVEAYRSVTLAARLVASIGRDVDVDLAAAGRVRGRLAGAGDGWAHLEDPTGEILLLTDAVAMVLGLSEAAASAAAWPIASRRSAGAVLQRQVEGGSAVTVTLRDGTRRRGRGRRLGADFLELEADGGIGLLALSAIALVRRL